MSLRRAKVTVTEMLGVVSVSVSAFETADWHVGEEAHVFSYTTTLDAVPDAAYPDFLRDALVVAIENLP